MDEMTNIDTGDASTAAWQKYIKNICQGHDMDYAFNQIMIYFARLKADQIFIKGNVIFGLEINFWKRARGNDC